MMKESNKKLTFNKLQKKCLERSTVIKDWGLSEWMIGVAEEAGEIAGAIKRLNRLRSGYYDNLMSSEEKERFKQKQENNLGEEIADTICYLMLLANEANVDLDKAIIDKFNEVSDRMKSDVRL